MLINPSYAAGPIIATFIQDGELLYGLQRIDPTFDRDFNDRIFALASEGRPVRAIYVDGSDIGDTEHNGQHRYYLQFS